MLNQYRLSTAEEVAQEIDDHWDENKEFSRHDKGQAGFVAPVGKGPVRQEKGGKHGGKSKGNGKMHQRVGFQPERCEETFWRILRLVLAILATQKRSVG